MDLDGLQEEKYGKYLNYSKYSPASTPNQPVKIIFRSLLQLLAIAALSFGGWSWWSKNRIESNFDEVAFFYDLLWEMNHERDLAGGFDLVQDVHLQDWAGEVVQNVTEISALKTSEILERLQADVPSVATASIFVVYSDTPESLHSRLLEWARSVDGDHTHVAMRVFRDSNERGIGGLAMMVRRLPKFQPGLLGKAPEAFYNICPICNEAHHGKLNPVARSIVLECPKCDQRYDLLAVDLRGNYHRVNSFLNGKVELEENDIPAPDPDARLEELFSIWEKVLEHCRYVKDFPSMNGRRDAWQFADETDRYRNGDCEDTSILLADWLAARGFDARVALGRTDRFEGHAWCVVRLNDVEYILETTVTEPDRAKPPTSQRLGSRYFPEFLFDRNSIYFREGKRWQGEYWSNRDWVRVPYPMEEEPKVAALPAAE